MSYENFIGKNNLKPLSGENLGETYLINTEEHFSYKLREGDFEYRKAEFKRFCSDFLERVYSDFIEMAGPSFRDTEIYQMILRAENNPEKRGYFTREKFDFTKIFIKEIEEKTKDIFFSGDYSAQKEINFHSQLESLFFSSSPDIMENLKYDFYEYLLVLGEVRDTGLLNYINQSGAGEVTLSIDRVNLETTLREMNKLSIEDKVSFVKTLAHSARWALGNGDWAANAYFTSKEVIEGLWEKSNGIPLLKSIIKYQLDLINESEIINKGISFDDAALKFIQERKQLSMELTQDHLRYSTKFDIEQMKSPLHRGLRFQRVSRDYIAVVDGLNTSVALVEDGSVENILSQKEKLFSEIFEWISNFKEDPLQNILDGGVFLQAYFSQFMELQLREANFYVEKGADNVREKYIERKKLMLETSFNDFQKYIQSRSKNLTKKNPIDYEKILGNKSELISILHSPEILWSVNTDLGVNVQDMYLSEQVQFLDYLSGVKLENWNQLEQILKDDGVESGNVLRSFLSLDKGGPEMGQKILDIGEKLPAESANAIFAKYAELVDATKGIEQFIQQEFNEELAKDSDVINSVQEKILNKGVAVLSTFHRKLDSLTSENTGDIVQVINEALSKISADAVATLSTFKFARKNGFDLSLEDIQNSEFKKKIGTNITESERQDMVNIYRENYRDNPELAEALIAQFEESFSRGGSEFYIYLLNGKLNAFVRFEEKGDGKFASALNIASESKGYSLGEAMMEQALSREAENSILYAEANLDEWNTARYIELGFNGVEENKKYTVSAINIVWDNNLNEEYVSKNFSNEDILEKKVANESIAIEEYEQLSDFDRSRLGELVMTRSIFNKEDNKYYLVLEENKKKDL